MSKHSSEESAEWINCRQDLDQRMRFVCFFFIAVGREELFHGIVVMAIHYEFVFTFERSLPFLDFLAILLTFLYLGS